MELYWRDGGFSEKLGGQSYRIWREDWSGDQFEVLSREQFLALESFCVVFGPKFGIMLTQAED